MKFPRVSSRQCPSYLFSLSLSLLFPLRAGCLVTVCRGNTIFNRSEWNNRRGDCTKYRSTKAVDDSFGRGSVRSFLQKSTSFRWLDVSDLRCLFRHTCHEIDVRRCVRDTGPDVYRYIKPSKTHSVQVCHACWQKVIVFIVSPSSYRNDRNVTTYYYVENVLTLSRVISEKY